MDFWLTPHSPLLGHVVVVLNDPLLKVGSIHNVFDALFLDINNSLIPYFVDKSQLHKSNLLRLKFEDVSSEIDAEQLLKKEVYLPLALLPKLEGNTFYYHEIIGFHIVDENFGSVGLISGVNDSSAQVLFEIDRNGTEILIPLNDDIIRIVDRNKKTVTVATPPGLIDLYLE